MASLADRLIARVTRRPPDFVIGGAERPYLRRWWILPRNRLFNVYLHHFLRSDDDRALHDHPWSCASIILRGSYVEHTIADGGVNHQRELRAGDWRIRWTGRFAHRIELLRSASTYPDGKVVPRPLWPEVPCWTLFITGPRYREWGFHCERGWVHWKRFTAADDAGAVGPGCEAGA